MFFKTKSLIENSNIKSIILMTSIALMSCNNSSTNSSAITGEYDNSTPKATITTFLEAVGNKNKNAVINCFSKISFKYDNVNYRSSFQHIIHGNLNNIGDSELEELKKMLNNAEITDEVIEGDDAEISIKIIIAGDSARADDGRIIVGKPSVGKVKANLQKKNNDWLITHL